MRQEVDKERKMLIGIAGGIGSGKSVVSRILRLKGYEVYDCDLEARRLMTESRVIREAVVAITGRHDVYDSEGNPDRKRLAGILFADKQIRNRINTVVHSAVREDLSRFICGQSCRLPVFVESAIMGSSGLAGMCGSVWIVEAPEKLRVRRVAVRSNLREDEIIGRMKAQGNEEELIRSVNICVERIVNDGENPLLEQIDELLEKTGYNNA